jgi:ATP/maltotriose-dependent transcriptional regulator MalT
MHRSRPQLEAGLAAALRCGDRWSATWSQAALGLLAEGEGQLAEAIALYQTRLETCEQVGDSGGVAWSLHQLAKVSLEQQDLPQAIYYCRESLRVALEISSGNSINEAIWRISFVLRQRGQPARAVELLAALQAAQPPVARPIASQLPSALDEARAQLSSDAYNAALAAGSAWTPPALGMALMDELAALLTTTPHAPASQHLPEALSERELEVLRLMADGLSNSEIAERLVVTTGTVKKHLNNIYGKLGVERRTQALLRAQELRLIEE